MSANNPPMGFDSVSQDINLEADLGNVYEGKDGKAYRLCKALNPIAAVAKKTLVADLAANGTFAVDVTSVADAADVVGVVPADIVQEDVAAGDYFFCQCAGRATALAADAITQDALVATSTTAGSIDDLAATAGLGGFAWCVVAAGGAGDVEIFIRGLR